MNFFFSSVVAVAAIASPAPTSPKPSFVFAFMLTVAKSISRSSAMHLFICPFILARFGFWRWIMRSTFAISHSFFCNFSFTVRSSCLLSIFLNFSSVSGKRVPMSPIAAAPRRASIRA